MEERITSMLKLVEEDADSFAKKAEMYFRRRPELINFVQEFYKSYRALAERYDHISGELQKANNTIAAVFPDKHFGMDDEDETSSQISPSESLRHSSNFCEISPTTVNDPIKYKEVELDSTEHNQGSEGPTSQTTTDDAKEEIENLQKEILILQTEKEFIKVSYESVLTKYWNIEKDIAEMQEKIYGLQNETSTTTAIEDDEARALMAVTALKSCEETLIKLQEQQKGTVEEAKVESERIKSIKEKLIALKGNANHQVKGEYSSQEDVQQSPIHEDIQAVYNMNQGQNEMQSIYQKVRRSFKSRSETSVMDFADKMDDLVAKVVSMEIEVSSQTTQIHRLRKENDELSNHLQHIQNENRVITGDSKGLSGRFRQVDAELQRIKDLDTSIHNARNVLRSHFSEACHSFKDLSSRLQSPENQEYTVAVGSCGTEDFDHNGKIHQDFKSMESWKYSTDGPSEKNSMPTTDSESRNNNIVQENALETSLPDCSTQDEKHYCIDTDYLGKESDKDSGCPNWQLSLARLEEKQKIVLTEYTSILRNYKETKRKLAEADKKSQEYILETTDQIRDLKNSIVMKDEEIRTLRQKLSYMEASWNQNADTNRSEPKPPMTNTFLRKGQQKISYSRSFNFILGKMSTARLKDGGDSVLCSVEEGVELGDSLTGRSPFVDPKAQKVDAKSASSAIEEKFRREIDELLEENLGFWLRFGSSFQHIQTYETTIEDLQNNIKELKDQRKRGGSATRSAKADATFFDRQLRDLQTDLAVWIEQNGLLKEELHIKFSSLCNIKEDIVRVCNEGGIKEGEQLTAYQGSRFIGEIADMQQENNKVAEELQAGLAYAKNLQAVVQRMLAELNETFDISRTEGSNENHFRRSSSKIRVPLRNYLFGVKPKKQSIFFCMSPEMQKQFSDLTAAQVL